MLGIAALVGAACSELGSNATETATVSMSQSDALTAQLVGGWYASVTGGAGTAVAMDKDTVAALLVQVSDIQFLPKYAEAQAADDAAWISLRLSAPVQLDLMALPTAGESPLVIASGTVPVGSYGDVRLFVSDATIRFKGNVDLGVAFSFEGGVDYAVEIPSGDQTGIKTDAEFTVEADEGGEANDVQLLFSPSATFLNVTGTGDGRVMLAPVIRSASEGA
jgi:hypothetical protein